MEERERCGSCAEDLSAFVDDELDEATELDDGDPAELASNYVALLYRLSHLNVFGGCCGTDHRYLAHISAACQRAEPPRTA